MKWFYSVRLKNFFKYYHDGKSSALVMFHFYKKLSHIRQWEKHIVPGGRCAWLLVKSK